MTSYLPTGFFPFSTFRTFGTFIFSLFSQPSLFRSSSPSFRNPRAPPRKIRLSLQEQLPSPSLPATLSPSSASLTQLLSCAQIAELAAVRASLHPEPVSQLLSFAVLHTPVFLRLQRLSHSAPSTPPFTKTQFLFQLFDLFTQHCLQALRVRLFVRRSSSKILTVTHASPPCRPKRLIKQTISTSTR